MDLICPIDREPWDNDSLHEEVAARIAEGKWDTTYRDVAAAFRSRGCKALETAFGPQVCEPDNSLTSAAASAMYDLLGDDMDGAASMMDDFDYLGMLD
jgi:hypothetical protein